MVAAEVQSVASEVQSIAVSVHDVQNVSLSTERLCKYSTLLCIASDSNKRYTSLESDQARQPGQARQPVFWHPMR